MILIKTSVSVLWSINYTCDIFMKHYNVRIIRSGQHIRAIRMPEMMTMTRWHVLFYQGNSAVLPDPLLVASLNLWWWDLLSLIWMGLLSSLHKRDGLLSMPWMPWAPDLCTSCSTCHQRRRLLLRRYSRDSVPEHRGQEGILLLPQMWG